MNINAQDHGQDCVGAALQSSAIRIAPAASNKKPGTVSRPGTIGAIPEFQFPE
jgi:hypothetical protein